MNWNRVFRLSAMLFLILSFLVNFTSCKRPNEEHPQTDLVQRSVAASETDIDIAMYAINEIAGSGFGENFTLQFDEELNAIVLFTWLPGFARETEAALGGDEHERINWFDGANAAASAGASLHGLALDVGANVDVVIHVISDIDPDVIFITVKNGNIIYRAVQ